MDRRRLALMARVSSVPILLGLAVLFSTPPAVAQQPAPPGRSISVFDAPIARPQPECERTTELPPLLPVPPATGPRPVGPPGPGGEYDPGYFYLPERAPERIAPPAPCGPAGRFWIAPALELAWSKPAAVPALVRLGSSNGPVVYGNERPRPPFRAGFGLAGGFWVDRQQARGVDASFYYLPEGGTNTILFSDGVPLLLPTANGGAFPLANPAAGYAGSYQAGLLTRFASADVNYRHNLLCTSAARLDGLVGYRYGFLRDDFDLYGKRLGPDGEIVRFRDDVIARNQFHGGQVGLAGEYRFERWYVGGSGKVAFGTLFTDTNLSGKFRVNGTVVPMGFYARPGLAGPVEHTRFGVMPTLALTLGRQLGEHARVFVGYNFLYLSNLTRGPDVIDPTPTLLASNPLVPLPPASVRRDAATSDFWVQSVSLGMEWRY